MAPRSTCFPAALSASSGNPVAARASPPAPSCASSNAPAASSSGEILLRRADGTALDLVKLAADGADMRAIRGGEIGLVFQEPMSSLSAFHTVGNQLIEAIRLHSTLSKRAARRARSSCWRWSGSRVRRSVSTPIRSNCPADCASG